MLFIAGEAAIYGGCVAGSEYVNFFAFTGYGICWWWNFGAYTVWRCHSGKCRYNVLKIDVSSIAEGSCRSNGVVL